MQVPGGRAADRWGARRSIAVGFAFLLLGNAIALPAPSPWLGFLGRAIVGIGTGFAFIGGSDYIRARGGTATLQGVYGGTSVLTPGIALVVIPAFGGFRAPYLTTIVVVLLCAILLALAPDSPRSIRHAGERLDWSFVRDSRLYRFAVIHSFSFGFSVIVGNWVVTLLERHGQSNATAAAVGSLTLLLGFVTRVAGGAMLHREDAHRLVAGSLVLGGAAAIALALPLGLAGWVAAATLLGLAAGVPFARAFTGAAAARPDAPGAAVGFVNAWAALTIVAGTPLVGLTFSLPGDGRIGFVALGALAMLASLGAPR
jgi:fucose permease